MECIPQSMSPVFYIRFPTRCDCRLNGSGTQHWSVCCISLSDKGVLIFKRKCCIIDSNIPSNRRHQRRSAPRKNADQSNVHQNTVLPGWVQLYCLYDHLPISWLRTDCNSLFLYGDWDVKGHMACETWSQRAPISQDKQSITFSTIKIR